MTKMCIQSQVIWIEVIFVINVVKATIQRTALTIIARRNIVCPVSKVLPKVSQDAPVLLFGRNQTEAAEYVEGSSMESHVLEHT